MLRFAFRRFYFAVVGLLLLTLPLFAMARVSYLREYPPCWNPGFRCSDLNDAAAPAQLYRDGAFYAVWQRGFPPYDYWTLGLAIIVIVAAFEAIATVRARRRLTADG